ncbi:uncharacterized protein [Littorina saxatilis]|uniref:uncharacterized protein n=1 Tax=Littorina saxatilis TaxID=31220 RepID=UPI0038B42B13
MTEEEAQTYSQMVALEYDRIQMQDYENSILVQRRVPQLLERYPSMPVDSSDNYPLPMDSQEDFPVAMDTPEALFALERAQAASPKDQGFEFDPYDLLTALWNEAYGSGDVRAQALVGELFDKVRDDSDPDDEGQVRDILLDLIANSVMNEDGQMNQQQEYGWQPMVDDDDTYPMEPIREPVPFPAQPMKEFEDEEAANELFEQGQKRAAELPTNSEETKAVQNQQPMESSNAQQSAESKPIAASETNAGKSGEQEQQQVPEQLPTQKRAAETVPQA